MSGQTQAPGRDGGRRLHAGWVFVIGLALAFSVWGTFIFVTVGTKGNPPWDFSVIADIPGEASTSTARVNQFAIRTAVEPVAKERVAPQHVDGPHREWEVFEKVQRRLQ